MTPRELDQMQRTFEEVNRVFEPMSRQISDLFSSPGFDATMKDLVSTANIAGSAAAAIKEMGAGSAAEGIAEISGQLTAAIGKSGLDEVIADMSKAASLVSEAMAESGMEQVMAQVAASTSSIADMMPRFTIPEAALALAVSEKTVRRRIAAREIDAIKRSDGPGEYSWIVSVPTKEFQEPPVPAERHDDREAAGLLREVEDLKEQLTWQKSLNERLMTQIEVLLSVLSGAKSAIDETS